MVNCAYYAQWSNEVSSYSEVPQELENSYFLNRGMITFSDVTKLFSLENRPFTAFGYVFITVI